MMRRRVTLVGLTSAILLVMSLGFLPGLAAATSITIIDRFNSVSYSGSNGTQPWLTPWTEIGESDGPSAGYLSVEKTGSCSAGHCLELDPGANNVGITRRANLSGATTATLTYTLTVKGGGNSSGSLLVRVSSNGGSSWSTLNQHNSGAPKSATHTVDIVSWAGPNTAVSFLAQQSSGYWYVIDDVIINADIATPTTTTTTTTTAPSSTTTTTLPVTTTTLTPTSTTGPTATTSTTTTTGPVVSTTTTPGESTTTSTTPIDSTTTIEPPDSSGTATPAATPDDTPAQQPQPTTALSARMKRTDLAATELSGAAGSIDDSEASQRAPLTGLSGVFTGSMATIRSNLLQAVILGILLAWALVTGVGRRSKDDPAAQDD